MLILIVAGGPEKGRTYELLDDTPVVLGREGDPIRLSDRKASRQHARLWCEGNRWYVRDLGSRHGTYYNHKLVDQRAELSDGDYLQVGGSVFVIARIPMEHAERLALLRQQGPVEPADKPGLLATRSHRLMAGGVAAAIGLTLTLSAVQLYTSSQRDSTMQQRLTEMDRSEATRSISQRLDQALAQLEAQQDRDVVLERILATVSKPNQDLPPELRQQLDTVLAELDGRLEDQPELAKQVDALAEANRQELAKLRASLAGQAEASRAATESLASVSDGVDQVLGTLGGEENPADSLQAATTALREQLASASPAIDQLSQQLESTGIQQHADTERVLAAIDEVKTAIPAQTNALTRMAEANHTLMSTMLAELEDDRAQADVLAAIEEIKTALPADTSQRLDRVLAAAQAQPETQLTQEQVAEVVNRAVEPLAEIAAGAERAQPTEKLDRVLAALQQREQTDRKLAELYETLKSQPEQTQQMLQQAVASLRSEQTEQGDERAQAALRRVLGEIRGKMITDTDRIGRIVQRKVAAAMAERDATTHNATTDTDADASAMVQADREAADAATPEELTRRERAYKLAFESGQVVTLGAGQLNPETGEISDGRILDPTDAKDNGIQHWRDWYLMDDMAERMRLQELAHSYREERGDGPAVTSIPIPQRPEASDNEGAAASLDPDSHVDVKADRPTDTP